MDSGEGAAPPPLTPVSFLERSGSTFKDRLAIVDGEQHFTYGEFLERSQRLAAAIRDEVLPGDRVAALCVNGHVMLEMHNGVPGAGAVLVPLNFRLGADDLAVILHHSGTKLLIADAECGDLAISVGNRLGLRVVVAGDNDSEYERLLARSQPESFDVSSETDLLAINYTSGSTGTPKGVMYNHRGAYLQALAMSFHLCLDLESSYLWTLPMFHCDGWCHTWAVTAAGATHNCVRKIDPPAIWRTIATGSITHLAGAPIVLTMLAEAAASSTLPPPDRPITAALGGAPPTPTLIDRLSRMNISVTHLYGLTETYGPVVVNQWQPEWSNSSEIDQFAYRARQGIDNVVSTSVRVIDKKGNEVPNDGETTGEIIIKGNNVTTGYYRDPEGTAAVLVDGWLHTGDLAVRHPNGYLEVRDRAKDIVIVGGENVSSVEIERIICEHHAVLEAAVVSLPDDRWGEVPVAIVALRESFSATETEIIEFVRSQTTHFKAPKRVHFAEIPKTSTGKVQKHVLRDWVRNHP